MTLTRIRLVSLYIKFTPVTMTDIFILVLISISSALVTVDSHLSTSNDPSPSYTTYPEDDIGGVKVQHRYGNTQVPVVGTHQAWYPCLKTRRVRVSAVKYHG